MGERPTRQQHDDIGQLYDNIADEADVLNARMQAILASFADVP